MPARLRTAPAFSTFLRWIRGSLARRMSTLLTPTEVASHASNRLIVDIRPLDPAEATDDRGGLHVLTKCLSAPWRDGSMPMAALPSDKTTPLLLHCRHGHRAAAAAQFLRANGFINVSNGGGPNVAEVWEAYGEMRHEHRLGGFAQMFDGEELGGSSTYTYLLWDQQSKEASLQQVCCESFASL